MPNISYVSKGEGDIILFLHGWGQNKEMMLPLVEQIKNKYKCIVLDLPGFGDSCFNGEKKLEEYLKNLREFLKSNNILPKYIIGHSFGGKLATMYYLKYRDISGLVIIASPLLKPNRNIKYYYKIYTYKLKKIMNIRNNNKGSEDYKNCSEDMKSFFVDVVNTHLDKQIKDISIPTLLIWGEKDKKVPLNKGKKLEKKIVNSELFVQKGGHFAYLDNIQFTKLIIQRFLRRNKSG